MSFASRRRTKPLTAPKPSDLALRPGTIERVFTDCVMDLREVVVLDGIDILPHGFRVRCHDLHGPLEEIVIENSGDTFVDNNRLVNPACRSKNAISCCGLGSKICPVRGDEAPDDLT